MVDLYIWIGVWVVILIMCIVELGKVESRFAEDRINKMFEDFKHKREEEVMPRYTEANSLDAIKNCFVEDCFEANKDVAELSAKEVEAEQKEFVNAYGLRLEKVFRHVYQYGWNNAIEMAKRDKDRVPTADVRENIHGMWIIDEDGNIECSVCGHHGVGDLYCERCGAQMDEGREE